jgi:hypothetical protein
MLRVKVARFIAFALKLALGVLLYSGAAALVQYTIAHPTFLPILACLIVVPLVIGRRS